MATTTSRRVADSDRTSVDSVIASNPGALREAAGYLDMVQSGFGFLRTWDTDDPNGAMRPKGGDDIYIAGDQMRATGARHGDYLVIQAGPPETDDRNWKTLKVVTVNGMTPEQALARVKFDDDSQSKPTRPNEWMQLAVPEAPHLTCNRLIDLFAPIGFGQRALVFAPPDSGKSTLLLEVAAGVLIQHKDALLLVILVGERPEEITDTHDWIRRLIRKYKLDPDRYRMIAASFKRPTADWVAAAKNGLEWAKRQAEGGKKVVVLFDSITRFGEGINSTLPPGGRTLSGGLDTEAEFPLRNAFGSGALLGNGGSVTLIATCLIDTPSKLDAVIAEKMYGTSNCAIVLDPLMAQYAEFPAIDAIGSSTRHANLFVGQTYWDQMVAIRGHLVDTISALGGYDKDGKIVHKNVRTIMRQVLDGLKATPNNETYLTKALTLSKKS